jgi:hypothetical protein
VWPWERKENSDIELNTDGCFPCDSCRSNQVKQKVELLVAGQLMPPSWDMTCFNTAWEKQAIQLYHRCKTQAKWFYANLCSSGKGNHGMALSEEHRDIPPPNIYLTLMYCIEGMMSILFLSFFFRLLLTAAQIPTRPTDEAAFYSFFTTARKVARWSKTNGVNLLFWLIALCLGAPRMVMEWIRFILTGPPNNLWMASEVFGPPNKKLTLKVKSSYEIWKFLFWQRCVICMYYVFMWILNVRVRRLSKRRKKGNNS